MNDFKLVVGGRFWGKEGDGNKVDAFIKRASKVGAEKVLVAINEDSDDSGVLNQSWPEEADVFSVKPWGKFTPALNAILGNARQSISSGANLLYASIEVSITPEVIKTIVAHFDSNTLCVGARLEGHAFDPIVFNEPSPANGREIPWNTLCLWNSSLLWRTGFLNIGNGVAENEKNAGVEEFCTMAAIQHLYGADHAQVKLVQIPGIVWETDFEDPERQAKHEAKMQSKVERPATQLDALGTPAPLVQHIVL